jgi:hypothetical protein
VPRVAAVVLACAAALSACSDGPDGAEEPAETAHDATSSATTASSRPLGPAEREFLQTMSQAIGEQGSAVVEVRSTGMLRSTARGVVAYDEDGSRLRMTSRVPSMGDEPTRLVVTDEATFVSVPGITPPGKYVALAADDPRLQQWAGGGTRLGPQESLAAFRAGLRDVRVVGEERVGGTATTRYRLEVDAAAALAAQGRTPPPAMPESTAYDAWLDDAGRMRRLTTQVAGSRVVVELSRWGIPVQVEAPPPSDVVAPGG